MRRGRLSDLVDQVTTKAVGRKPEGLPYVGLEHVEPGTRTLVGTAPSSISVSTNGVFESGDVLFGKLRPNLRKAVQMTFGGYCSTDFLILRPRSGVYPRYAGHVASSDAVFSHAERNSIGTGMPRTSWHAVSHAPISVPPLEEQRRIAELLDTIDETIQATERVIAKKEAIRSGLVLDLLNGKSRGASAESLNAEGTSLPPGSTSGSRRSENAGWTHRRLADVGVVIGGGTPSREQPECWGGTIPWLTPGEITGSSKKYISDTQDYITEYGLSASGARLLPEGTLLMTSRASIGSCALAGRSMATNQGFKNLIPGSSVDSSYLFFLGRTLSREMTRRASGTTFLEISAREFGRIEICVPPLEEQRQIVEILDTIDDTVSTNERRLDKLRQLRAGLAADLLSGRVRTVPP